MVIDELTAERAREIGIKIGQTSHPDIVDVHIALAAAERGHAVLTSDNADIAKVNGDLILVHVRVSGRDSVELALPAVTMAPRTRA